MTTPMPTRIIQITCAAIDDGLSVSHAPGAILLELTQTDSAAPPLIIHGRPVIRGRARVLAVGAPADVATHPALAASAVPITHIDLPTHAVIPGLVNAHTHLDLTHIGPTALPPGGGFRDFAGIVMNARCVDDADIAASVRRGIELNLAGGVVAVGDIAGHAAGRPRLEPWRTLRQSPLSGVSFIEFFALGTGAARSRDAMTRTLDEAAAELQEHANSLATGQPISSGIGGTGVPPVPNGPALPHRRDACATDNSIDPDTPRLGLSPHAPYSVERAMYAWAQQQSQHLAAFTGTPAPVMTHLAESSDERDFITNAQGPMRAFLERLSLWEERLRDNAPTPTSPGIGHGRSPIAHLAPLLAQSRTIIVHANDVSEADLDLLAHANQAVGLALVYCPRSSAYFNASGMFGPHRWRDMLARGIPVALGTDSIINLPNGSERAETGLFSSLAEMRHLWQSTPHSADLARQLLRMATTDAAAVLDIPNAGSRFTLAPNAEPLGLAAVRVEPKAATSPGSAWVATPTATLSGGGLAAVLDAITPAELLFVRNESGLAVKQNPS
jgi:aminodeoxyfutalosine deaminase